MDIVDTPTRSRMMAAIRSQDTQPELRVRHFLHTRGFRYRLHDRTLPGSPDIVLPRYRVAIFVNGCFWHQHHDCKFATIPNSNREKWKAKFSANVARDQKSMTALTELGWRPMVIWECELKKARDDAELEWIVNDLLG